MICENPGCNNEFEKVTHNQKYCGDECCRIATNLKIKQKNKEKRDRLSGKVRICSTRGCKTILSKYSEADVCELCVSKAKAIHKKNLLGLIGL